MSNLQLLYLGILAAAVLLGGVLWLVLGQRERAKRPGQRAFFGGRIVKMDLSEEKQPDRTDRALTDDVARRIAGIRQGFGIGPTGEIVLSAAEFLWLVAQVEQTRETRNAPAP